MKKNIVIAGGGTGGHIYPGLSVSEALKDLDPEVEIHWVGSSRGLEALIIPKYKLALHLLPIGPLNGVGFFTKLKTLIFFPFVFIQSLFLILKLRPHSILGVGGYASGPFMALAGFFRMKTVLFEPNSHPGLTNKILAPLMSKIFVNFEDARKIFQKAELIGIPVRKELAAVPSIEHGPFRVFIFGGSQGARGINKVVAEAIKTGGTWLDGVEIIHQIGNRDFQHFKGLYESIGCPNLTYLEYVHDMFEKYKWADLVFCRAGASTIAELAAMQKAAIFIPLPTAADNHQLKNALSLELAGAGIVVEQEQFTPIRFIDLIRHYKENKSELGVLKTKISRFFFPGCAEKIAKCLLETTNQPKI